jgi:hypothetical protein
MADDSTTRQTATDDESGVHRLRDIVVEEVSLVDRAANKRRFLLVKRSSQMANDGKLKGASSASRAGGKKPRPKPDKEVDKTRPRVMRAASEDEDDEDEDDADETEKARRSTESEDDEGDEDDEDDKKARHSTGVGGRRRRGDRKGRGRGGKGGRGRRGVEAQQGPAAHQGTGSRRPAR